SATKVHRMPQGLRAAQQVCLCLEEGAELEYYPGLAIPYPGAEHHQRTEVFLSSGSRFGFLEIWAMGRILRGERLAFRRITADLGVYAEGTPVYREALHLDPTVEALNGTGLLEGARYVGSGFWRWGGAEPEFREGDGVVLAAGRTGYGDLYLKALARDGLLLQQRIEALLTSWRARWGLPPIDWRRYGSGWG
ncbi:MAG: urease accessory protein UreD, partial [Armatimonadota bacterium]|nr:urease accessory protein UreD [Armatimonadota bacterium]